MLKKFARSRTAWKSQIAPGFTITKLGAEKYVPDADREDVALRQTMQGIYDRLAISLEVDHPVTPGSKLTKGPKTRRRRFSATSCPTPSRSWRCWTTRLARGRRRSRPGTRSSTPISSRSARRAKRLLQRPSHRPTAAALASSVMVISNSARTGGVAEEGWDVFTSGQAWKEEGHPGKLTSWEVLYRARSAGSRPYNAFTWNCESFVAYCHGLPSASPQLAVAVVVALVGAAIIARS